MNESVKTIQDLILYYYKKLDNPSGGYLHIVLDDGNIEHSNIRWCMDQCLINGDNYGYLLGNILLHIPEDELWDMYNDKWWGMD